MSKIDVSIVERKVLSVKVSLMIGSEIKNWQRESWCNFWWYMTTKKKIRGKLLMVLFIEVKNDWMKIVEIINFENNEVVKT